MKSFFDETFSRDFCVGMTRVAAFLVVVSVTTAVIRAVAK
jgi:hypothetical protein